MGVSRQVRTKATLPSLPYAYDGLEPAISEQIMRLHHGKHHATYIANLNAAQETLARAVSSGDVKGSIAVQPAIKFNGGGHLNRKHSNLSRLSICTDTDAIDSLFWENLAPVGETTLGSGALRDQIERQYGGLDGLQKEFGAALASIQGSGWGWLVKDAKTGSLKIVTTPNQDPVTGGDVVVLGVDAWEHAYYLQYENAKVKYFEAIWSVINWDVASKRFSA
ncbi:Superoxide dismutase [Mn],mitochondrial [Taphrina deformans PYCC 5710]|uniref:Superoxide dismutase n=1 Tax=Taphrina deformans (strain PYCC 5710 / ATCC 11124 / CBS 356.35 / IMI 108563 / JCM 9778 / NBRC 8474) TaxID=1097556 RepID=R4X8R7_TAPDE|nr:Superoxide dismutase [Mn],mitochondrial [Taphrina deformans PYCC 5710]|eukprot:CCG81795.1 Superoxide dismutase [Mn],mitochondrial [Taphrina deformans PYCC 5710]